MRELTEDALIDARQIFKFAGRFGKFGRFFFCCLGGGRNTNVYFGATSAQFIQGAKERLVHGVILTIDSLL